VTTAAAIGLVHFQREHIVARLFVLVQNRKNGFGQRIGEIGDFLAHLADRAAKLYSGFGDISRPILKA
jgi:hypothetical protein